MSISSANAAEEHNEYLKNMMDVLGKLLLKEVIYHDNHVILTIDKQHFAQASAIIKKLSNNPFSE